jgi:hypothetical protein
MDLVSFKGLKTHETKETGFAFSRIVIIIIGIMCESVDERTEKHFVVQ